MRITLCTHNLNREGASFSLLLLAEDLEKIGHQCHIFSPTDGPLQQRFAQAGISFQIIPRLYDPNHHHHNTLLKNIAKHADIVVVNTILGYSLVEQCKLANIPVIWIIHESERAVYETRVPNCTRSALRSASAVVFPADATRCMYIDCLSNNAYVIPNGINIAEVDRHLQKAHTQQLLGQYNLPINTNIVTLVGTICPHKGQYEFIEASIRIAHTLPDQPIIFLLVGGTRSYEHEAYLKRAQDLAKRNGIGSYIHVLPESDDALDIIALSTICICPSFIETCPRVILEAMACRRPVIASETYGIPELIEDGVHGLLIPPGHPDILADRIHTLLQDPEFAQTLANNARLRIEKEFDSKIIVRRYAELVDTVVGSQKDKMVTSRSSLAIPN